jgi:hypothetical protein
MTKPSFQDWMGTGLKGNKYVTNGSSNESIIRFNLVESRVSVIVYHPGIINLGVERYINRPPVGGNVVYRRRTRRSLAGVINAGRA